MQHSLEAYFLVNFAVDTALLTVVARANECMRLRRIVLSGFLAALYAVLTETVSVRLAHPAVQLLLLAVLSILLPGEADMHRCCAIALQLLGGMMILGGTGMLIPEPAHFPVAAIGAALLLTGAIFFVRFRKIYTWDVTVTLALKGRSVSFRALIDTGNRLHEPVSGLPVLIAESRLLERLFMQTQPEALPCRHVRFGALGGSGTIRCFRPDAVLIRRGDCFVHAPDVWVAIYPGHIPGPARALAPPSFAVIHGNSLPEIHSKRGDI